MLAGQPPFGGANEADLLNNIRTRELRAPSDVSPASVSILKRVSNDGDCRLKYTSFIYILFSPTFCFFVSFTIIM